MKVADFTDDAIVIAVDRGDYCGGRGYTIACRLGLNPTSPVTRALHRRLLKLEAAGRVHRDERRSACNSIYWFPGPQSDGVRLYPGDPVANAAKVRR